MLISVDFMAGLLWRDFYGGTFMAGLSIFVNLSINRSINQSRHFKRASIKYMCAWCIGAISVGIVGGGGGVGG